MGLELKLPKIKKTILETPAETPPVEVPAEKEVPAKFVPKAAPAEQPHPEATRIPPQRMPQTDEFGFMVLPSPRKLPILIKPINGVNKHVRVFATGPIKNLNDYGDLILLAQQAIEGDYFEIYADSPGGHATTGMKLRQIFKDSKAYIKIIIMEMAASAMAVAATGANEIEFGNTALFMYHWSTQGMMNHSLNLEQSLEQWNIYLDTIVRGAVDDGFVTEEEYSEMKDKRKDIFVSRTQMTTRMKFKTTNTGEVSDGQ